MLTLCLPASAQRFFNLTSSQIEIDSVMPEFSYSMPLEDNYEDSVYTVSILYPEYIDMTSRDLANYEALTDDSLPETPIISRRIAISRKKASLEIFFRPLVMREGRGQILVSFMLKVESAPKSKAERRALAKTRAAGTASRYATKSVLAEGKWAKIRVPETGLYQLTDAYVRKLGFTSLAKVKVYGYGGNLQPEKLDAEYLAAHDDLMEVPTYEADGRKLFHGLGPVTWSTNSSARRTRNPYSDYGYYFLTENDAEPLTADSANFVKAFYPSPDDYHVISESDGFSWYHGGRNLFDARAINLNSTQATVLSNEAGATSGRLTVNITAGVVSTARVMINDSLLGNIAVSLPKYYTGNESTATYNIKGLHATDTVKITTIAGGPVHLDFVSMAWTKPKPAPKLSQAYPSPEYVYHITNQNLHADSALDMVIVIPTSQKLRTQADRLANFHRDHDGLRVKVVPADELFNEFSSGTPDANAYRRYLKMLYDRAVDDKDMPRFLLLFGDCVWDNRMLTSNCRTLSPDDYLLAYESENSFSETSCYVD
ncbi:MAG: C25 family cysteine peptidase, partial [Prevotella sp.]